MRKKALTVRRWTDYSVHRTSYDAAVSPVPSDSGS
jgi:hypothetical protein